MAPRKEGHEEIQEPYESLKDLSLPKLTEHPLPQGSTECQRSRTCHEQRETGGEKAPRCVFSSTQESPVSRRLHKGQQGLVRIDQFFFPFSKSILILPASLEKIILLPNSVGKKTWFIFSFLFFIIVQC